VTASSNLHLQQHSTGSSSISKQGHPTVQRPLAGAAMAPPAAAAADAQSGVSLEALKVRCAGSCCLFILASVSSSS
jgi:hypothetical protein